MLSTYQQTHSTQFMRLFSHVGASSDILLTIIYNIWIYPQCWLKHIKYMCVWASRFYGPINHSIKFHNKEMFIVHSEAAQFPTEIPSGPSTFSCQTYSTFNHWFTFIVTKSSRIFLKLQSRVSSNFYIHMLFLCTHEPLLNTGPASQ